jgi:hypothetical protein
MALTDKLVAIANAIRGKTGKEDPLTLEQMVTEIEGIEAGGGAAPDGMEVTFGYENGEPVAREEAYTISSANLNELGRISQTVAGKSVLMTLDEMLYHLDRAKFLPTGYANCEWNMNLFDFEPSAVGELQEG